MRNIHTTQNQRPIHAQHIHRMALVSGPGRGGASANLPDELQLAVDAHVKYIQSLDTVGYLHLCRYAQRSKWLIH
jgi:hypothetical protein